MLEAVSRKLEISEQAFHRWQHIYDGTKGPEMTRPEEDRCERGRGHWRAEELPF
jgi:hypothetical protein